MKYPHQQFYFFTDRRHPVNFIYISGGNMAAPMAGELIANIMDYLGYDKTGSSEMRTGSPSPT